MADDVVINGLFQEPPRGVRQLSAMYSVPAYRASPKERAIYSTIKAVRIPPCDECFANQHETRGNSGPRGEAKMRRAFRGGPTLNLCRAHEELWRNRDREDAPPR